MANYDYDVLRVEGATTGTGSLLSVLRSKQSGFENDGLRRMVHKDASGNPLYWTPDGSATGVEAYDVYYENTTINVTNAGSALDYLTQIPLAINTFTISGSTYKGATVNTATASFGATGSISTFNLQNPAGLPGDISPALTSYAYTGLGMGPTGVYMFSLDVASPWKTVSAYAYIYFMLMRYYGTSASATPDETAIEAGTAAACADAAASRVIGSTSIAGGGNYIYYSYPAAWGALSTILVNGFGSTWNQTTVSVTNGSGNTENYYCYTSPFVIAGTITLSAS